MFVVRRHEVSTSTKILRENPNVLLGRIRMNQATKLVYRETMLATCMADKLINQCSTYILV